MFSGADVGTNFTVHAVNADGTPREFPPLALSRGVRRLDFASEHELVLLKGDLSHKNPDHDQPAQVVAASRSCVHATSSVISRGVERQISSRLIVAGSKRTPL